MATAQQRKRAREDKASGKKLMLHTTKLNPKLKAHMHQIQLEMTHQFREFVAQSKYAKRFSVSAVYDAGDQLWTLYLRDPIQATSHTITIDFRLERVVVYEDSRVGGTTTVCRDADAFINAVALLN